MRLVAEHADWWNVHTHIVDKLDEMRPFSGNARCSLQAQVAFVPAFGVAPGDRGDGPPAFRTDPDRRHRRPSSSTTSARSGRAGVERVYAWFCDFAAPDTLAAFGEGVIGQSGTSVASR